MLEDNKPSTGRCNRCGNPDGNYVYGPLLHGGTFICERCQVETNLADIKERAVHIPKMEKRLEELGGPAKHIVCGYVIGRSEVNGKIDPAPWYSFCILPQYHNGFHKVVDL